MPDPAHAFAPYSARRALSWMAAHDERLRDLLAGAEDVEFEGEGEALDVTVHAHLRFLAEALEHTSDGDLASQMEGVAGAVDEWYAEQADEMAALFERARAAIALEEHLQYGVSPGTDPSLDLSLERRARVRAWGRMFLLGVELHLGPSADGMADVVLAWMMSHQTAFLYLTVTFDNRARAGLPSDAGAHTRDAVARTAFVRAYVRHMAEALEHALAPGGDDEVRA